MHRLTFAGVQDRAAARITEKWLDAVSKGREV